MICNGEYFRYYNKWEGKLSLYNDFFSDTYPQSHLIAMAYSIRWVQITIFQRTGSENNVIRHHLVRKQGEMLDSKMLSHLTNADGCGNEGIVLCWLKIHNTTSWSTDTLTVYIDDMIPYLLLCNFLSSSLIQIFLNRKKKFFSWKTEIVCFCEQTRIYIFHSQKSIGLFFFFLRSMNSQGWCGLAIVGLMLTL